MSIDDESLTLATDEKTERLLNLVIALLGTNGFIKKSQILAEIPGYSGSSDARERMFERDKEELRKLGIPIQVSSLDPLFDDEQGYRIVKTEYGFQLGSLTTEESMIIRAAFELMRSKAASRESRALKRRIMAASSKPGSDDEWLLGEIRHGMALPDNRILDLFQAIRNQKRVSFSYQGQASTPIINRILSPRGIGRKGEDWLVIGFDHDKEAVRTFNLLQILGEIRLVDGDFHSEPIDLNGEFDGIHQKLEEVVVQVASEIAPFFELEGGRILRGDELSSEIAFHVPSVERLLRILISLTSAFKVLAPESAKKSFESLIEKLIHGH